MEKNDKTPSCRKEDVPIKIVTSPEDSLLTASIASTESETFETWTLVTDTGGDPDNSEKQQHSTKTKKIDLVYCKPADKKDHRIEEIIDNNENNKRDIDNIDDLSDGISIISDNESAGRNSPHPCIVDSASEEHFISSTTLNLGDKPIEFNNEQITSTIKEIEATSENQQKELETTDGDGGSAGVHQEDENAEQRTIISNFIGFGVKGIFLFSVIIAFAAFFGKMKYPEWEQLSLISQISPLTQRIEDLELQNNLLRAEIDILNKQVNYMNTGEQKSSQFRRGAQQQHNEGGQGGGGGGGTGGTGHIGKNQYKQQQQRINERKQKFVEDRNRGIHPSQKVWSGAGNIEDREEPIQVVFTQSNNIDKKKTGDKSKILLSNEQGKDTIDFRKNGGDSKVYYEKKFDKNNNKNQKYPSTSGGNGGKNDNKYQKHDTGSGKQYDHHYGGGSSSSDGEHKKSDYHHHHHHQQQSKEFYQKDEYDKNRKQNNRKGDSNENHHDSDYNKIYKNKEKYATDWHEQLMQQREEARKKHLEKRLLHNWYIERGSGREEARVYDKKDYLEHRKIVR